MPRIYSGHPIPALRPEQSDHVPWADCPQGLSSSTGCPVSHSSLPVALLASHLPCGSLWAAPKAPLGPRFPSGRFAALTRRKKASIAHFDGGARNVARNGIGQLSPAFGVRSCSPFPPSKWAGLFPSAAYRRSAPPQLARGRLNHCELGYCIVAWWASQHGKTKLFFSSAASVIHTQISLLGCFDAAWIFLQHKRPAWFHFHAGLCCKPEGLSPDGGLFYSTSKEATPNRRAMAPVVPRQ